MRTVLFLGIFLVLNGTLAQAQNTDTVFIVNKESPYTRNLSEKIFFSKGAIGVSCRLFENMTFLIKGHQLLILSESAKLPIMDINLEKGPVGSFLNVKNKDSIMGLSLESLRGVIDTQLIVEPNRRMDFNGSAVGRLVFYPDTNRVDTLVYSLYDGNYNFWVWQDIPNNSEYPISYECIVFMREDKIPKVEFKLGK